MSRRPLLVTIVALLALAVAFSPQPRQAVAEDPISITVEPASPTSQDTISVTVAGDMGEPFCNLTSQSVVDFDQHLVIIFVQDTSQFCTLLLPTTFSITEQIDPLPPGEYRTWVYSPFDVFDGLELVLFDVSGVPVGGVAELPHLEPELSVADSSDVSAGLAVGIVAAVAVCFLALGGAAWYTRKRLTG